MSMTDPVSDFLNRIMNAQQVRYDKVDIPASKMKTSIARILKEEGYIRNFKLLRDGKQGMLRIHLKYDDKREALIRGLKRESRPSCRRYVGHDEIPKVLNGLGIAILSTSRGIMTDRQARSERVGGELLCSVW